MPSMSAPLWDKSFLKTPTVHSCTGITITHFNETSSSQIRGSRADNGGCVRGGRKDGTDAGIRGRAGYSRLAANGNCIMRGASVWISHLACNRIGRFHRQYHDERAG